MKAGDIVVQGRNATVPLSLIATGFILWATWVTAQLASVRETLADINARIPAAKHAAANKL